MLSLTCFPSFFCFLHGWEILKQNSPTVKYSNNLAEPLKGIFTLLASHLLQTNPPHHLLCSDLITFYTHVVPIKGIGIPDLVFPA